LDLTHKNLGPADLGFLFAVITSFSKFTAAINEITLSSTGSPTEFDDYGYVIKSTGPRTYTLKGLQGGADPNLDFASKNFGAADLQFLSMVFTSFPDFTATLSDLNMMNNPNIGKLVSSQEVLVSALSNADDEITRERYQHFVMTAAGYKELDDAKWQSECTNLEVPHELAARECMDHGSFLKMYTKYNRDVSKDGSALGVGKAAGVMALCEGLKSSLVSKLNLSGCGIESTGLSRLADAISDMAALSEVNLQGAKVEESDIVALRSAATNVSLSW
jgi:hypothetical protein